MPIQKEISKENRTVYFDYLRILASFAVVFLHTSAQRIYSIPINSPNWHIINIYDSAVRWCVPIFIMISGALFLDNNRPLNIKKLYINNVLRIITALVFWALTFTAFKYPPSEPFSVKQFIIYSFKLPSHLWFLYMLAGLYIIVPLLRKITASMDMTRYFLVLSFLFNFIFPLIIEKINRDYIKINYNRISFSFALGYSFYFVLGYFLSHTDLKKAVRYIIYILGIGSFVYTFVMTANASLETNKLITKYYEYLTLNVALEGIAVFVFAQYGLSKIRIKSEKINSFIFKLSKYSFGIYLTHLIVLDKLNLWAGFNSLSLNPILCVPLVALTVFLISGIISFLLNHIPFLNKYIV